MKDLVEKLHRVYCAETGLDIPLRMGRDRAWYEWVRSGFTETDLVLVIRFLKKGIARQERNAGCLRFRNLIEMLDCFDEELAMARKAAAARPPTPRTVQATQQVGDIRRVVEKPANLEPTGTPELVRKVAADFRAKMRGGSAK